MRDRSLLSVLLLIGLALPVTSCSDDPSLTSIVITPSTETALLAPCGDPQVVSNFTATGYYTHPGHEPITKDITDQVTWKSFDTQLVTVDSSGVATVTTCADPTINFTANIIIEASAPGFHGLVIGYATFNEQEPTTTSGSGSSITSLVLTPSSRGALSVGQSVRFTVIGRTADGSMVSLPSQPKWTSSNPQAVSIDASTGKAEVVGFGKATMVAVYKNPDGSTAIGVSRVNWPSAY